MIIPIKIQCVCGQKYAFDIEPVNGRMPQSVSCPACGADGTATANEIVAQVTASPDVDRTASETPKAGGRKLKAVLWICSGAGFIALVVVLAGFIWWKQQSARDGINQSEVNRLENALKEAFAKKNPQLFLNQYYWEGTSEKDKQGMSESVSSFIVGGTLTKVSFTPNPSGKAETELIIAGGRYRPNLPVVGSIDADIVFNGKVKIRNQFVVGVTNGKMWIPGGGSYDVK